MTQVFLSWSGTIGNKVAQALNDWLPSVIQELQPFFSSHIDKGAVWQNEVYQQLDSSKFGIVCVTQDSKTSPWLHFEAGALSQKLYARPNPRVATFLHHVHYNDLSGPLTTVQGTKAWEREDVKKLVEMINKQCTTPLTARRLDEAFELTYPSLEASLESIAATDAEDKSQDLTGVEPSPADPQLKDLVLELTERFDVLSQQVGGLLPSAALKANRSLAYSQAPGILADHSLSYLHRLLDGTNVSYQTSGTGNSLLIELFPNSDSEYLLSRDLKPMIQANSPGARVRIHPPSKRRPHMVSLEVDGEEALP